jgi:polysaccharide export outer membrane protein
MTSRRHASANCFRPLHALSAAALAVALLPACGKRVAPQLPEVAASKVARSEAQQPQPPPPVRPEPPPEQVRPANPDQARPPSPEPPGPANPPAARAMAIQAGRQVGPRISTYYLSPGDEIRVSIFGSAELSRTLKIPPDSHVFFPMVGDIAVDGMSIPEFRQILVEKLRTADEQRIGTGDQITVKVFRNDDLGVTTIVPSSGSVNLPLAEEVELAGLTVEEANQAIAKKLLPYVVRPSVSLSILKSASGLPGRISDPQVSVEVLGFGGHKILVLGEVQNPGVYVNEGGGRVLEMVARAGGANKDAQMKNVALIRPGTETSPPRNTIVNLDRFIKHGDLEQNPTIQRGDIIYVPKTTIAKMALFFEQVYDILRPIVLVETGIWLGQNIDAGPGRRNDSSIVFPPE